MRWAQTLEPAISPDLHRNLGYAVKEFEQLRLAWFSIEKVSNIVLCIYIERFTLWLVHVCTQPPLSLPP